MPYKDPQQQREYERAWVAERRAAWFAGKICDWCGSTEDLQLDHRDPKKKVSHRIWSWSKARRVAELAKCRPLCRPCHAKKSASETARGSRNGMAKLVAGDIRAIRKSVLSHRRLGVLYGVHPTTIGEIKRREIWQYVV